MNKGIRVLYILVAALLYSGFAFTQEVESRNYERMLNTLLSHSVTEVDVDDVENNIDNYVLLDSRELYEYKVSHIAHAIHVGYDNFNVNSLPKINKNKPILVYCSVGYRSEKVTEQLVNAGYTNVSNLYGGIFEWKNQGNEVVNENGPTDEVHAYNLIWGVWLKEGDKVYGKKN